jgi:hypothetical protein
MTPERLNNFFGKYYAEDIEKDGESNDAHKKRVEERNAEVIKNYEELLKVADDGEEFLDQQHWTKEVLVNGKKEEHNFDYLGTWIKKRDGTLEMTGVGELYHYRTTPSITGKNMMDQQILYKGHFKKNVLNGNARMFVMTTRKPDLAKPDSSPLSAKPAAPTLPLLEAIAQISFDNGNPILDSCGPMTDVPIEDFPAKTFYGKLDFNESSPVTEQPSTSFNPASRTSA